MAGGGIGAAIQSLKQNRALLKKRKLKDKSDVYGKPNKTKLDLKQSTDQDMKIIRKKIEGYKSEERMTWIISIIILLGIIYGLYWWLSMS